ncbi:hypothetical protein [Nocardia sp. NPDC051570]|uniref:hypothetical protein n=1 Tax=Nocardia sp. NPDC051570 TaxID=3364324 RepID=UPI0037B32BEA
MELNDIADGLGRSGDLTRGDFIGALSEGMSLVYQELGLGERDWDLLDLAVKAILVRAYDDSASLDDVIEIGLDGVSPSEVRSWWTGWS